MSDDPTTRPAGHRSTPAVTMHIGQVTGGVVAGVITGPVHVNAASPPVTPAAPAAPSAAPAPASPPLPVASPPLPVTEPVPVAADVVYLSAAADEAHLAALALHLGPILKRLGVTTFHGSGAPAGTDLPAALDSAIRSARVVLLLVSPDYLQDSRCRAAERAAMARIPSGLRVVPISVRTVADWAKEPFGGLGHLPGGNEGLAVAEWPSKDAAWADVARGVAAVLSVAAK